jgi:uncharacterized membrane protein
MKTILITNDNGCQNRSGRRPRVGFGAGAASGTLSRVSHTRSHRAHGHPTTPRAVRLLLGVILLPLVAATLAGLVWLWPDGHVPSAENMAVDQADATVLDVHSCHNGIPQCQQATVQVTSGAGGPGRAEAMLPFGPLSPTLRPGDEVVVGHIPQAPPGQQYTFLDFDRTQPLLLLTGCFVAGVLLLSRWRGLGSLVGLGGSLLLICVFTLPALLQGSPPLPVAVVTASTIMIATLYLSHGFRVQTSVAMLGTLLALAITGLLGSLFTHLGHFTGLMQEQSGLLRAVAGQLDLSGLLLAGLVIGALGVLDDVTVTQAWAVWELADSDLQETRMGLFTRAMRIGRAHVASTVNTLVLAYVGATLPMLLLFSAVDLPFGAAVGQEVVAQEVVRGLVGGLGIIAAVPITTGIAALAARHRHSRTVAVRPRQRRGTHG